MTSSATMLAAKKATVVVVTGLSGAGRTTALRTLEDLGFYCIDNIPTALAPDAVALCERGGVTRLALGLDVRVRAFMGEVGKVLSLLENGGQRDVQVLFLDASDEAILRRFSETRRPHALAADLEKEGAASVLPRDSYLLPLSARSPEALTALVDRYRERLAESPPFGASSGTVRSCRSSPSAPRSSL